MKRLLLLIYVVLACDNMALSTTQDLSARDLIERLQQQMRELETIRATYNVQMIHGKSGSARDYAISYLRSKDRYHITESAGKSNEDIVQERRLVFNGMAVKRFQHDEGGKRQNSGQVLPPTEHLNHITRNDILALSGFTLLNQYYNRYSSEFEYKDLGTETIDGRECRKLITIMPYKSGQKGFIYYWIETGTSQLRLIRTLCLIENDPAQLLYRKDYKYGLSDTYPIPKEIEYERYNIDDSGQRTQKYRIHVSVETAMVNKPINDSEFDFQFPHGTLVQDSIKNISYVIGGMPDYDKVLDDLVHGLDVGAHGKTTTSLPNEPVTKMEQKTITLASSDEKPNMDIKAGENILEWPHSWYLWLFSGCACLAGFIILAASSRKKQKRYV